MFIVYLQSHFSQVKVVYMHCSKIIISVDIQTLSKGHYSHGNHNTKLLTSWQNESSSNSMDL